MLIKTKNSRGGVVNTRAIYNEDIKIEKRAIKQDNKDKLVVTVNGTNYASDTVSINYMASVITIANFRVNQLVSGGMAFTDAYTTVFKSNILWKTADKTSVNIQVENVAEALDLAMKSIGSLVVE